MMTNNHGRGTVWVTSVHEPEISTQQKIYVRERNREKVNGSDPFYDMPILWLLVTGCG